MIKIEINCEPSHFEAHLNALGFYRRAQGGSVNSGVEGLKDRLLSGAAQATIEPESEIAGGAYELKTPPKMTSPSPTTVRESDKPAPGRKRLTAEKVAKDEARGPSPAANISTGGARVDPAGVAQDAADEAAETAAAADGKLTHDAIRNAVARYAHAHSLEKAIADIRGIIGCAIADVPDTQEAIAAAVAKIDAAIANTPNVAAKETAEDSLFADSPPAAEQPKPARKEDVGLAISAYGIEYDGEGTMTAGMPVTREDLPRVLAQEFGADITTVRQISTPEQYGRAVVAIRRALQQNPFNRPSKRKT